MDALELMLVRRSRGAQPFAFGTQSKTFRNGVADTIVLSWQGGTSPSFATSDTLPSGFTLSSAGHLVYDGTSDTPGDYAISVTGTDGETVITATVTIRIKVYVAVRLWAGVDTTLYITNASGVFTAGTVGDWGGCGNHIDLRIYPEIYFSPKHGLKYSLDGGTTWSNWIFEDTNSTLDLSSTGFGDITSIVRVSARGIVAWNTITSLTISDPDGGSAPYIIDLISEYYAGA